MEAQGFKQPLLVGGATTSKRHAAVKLAPKSKKALHVLDASRAVPVVQQLIGGAAQDYLDDIQDEYDEIRTEYYEGLVDKKSRRAAVCGRAELLAKRHVYWASTVVFSN